MEDKRLILDMLKEKGRRPAKVREGVLDVLMKSAKPLSAAEISLRLEKKGMSANKTTLYRGLMILKEEGVVRELRLRREARCYEYAHGGHHYHLVCVNCHRTECVDSEESVLGETRKREMRNFKIMGQSVEFFGLCSDCQ